MKDAYEVLYQKEADLVRVRQEVESLRVAAALLADESHTDDSHREADPQAKRPSEPTVVAEPAAATGTDGPSPNHRQPSFWEFLKPARLR